MMGHTHALSGAAVWLAVTPLLQHHGYHLGPPEITAGLVVCAGAALLPDMDHHDGTIANTYGPVTKVLCRGVALVSGGHRHMTHSLAFSAAAGAGAWWLAQHSRVGWFIALFLLIGLGLRGVGIGVPNQEHASAILNAGIAGWLTWLMRDVDFRWAGIAVALGCVVHVVGDCLTPEGCPVVWPLPVRLAVPVVPRTDGKVEQYVITPVLTIAIFILAARTALGPFSGSWLSRFH